MFLCATVSTGLAVDLPIHSYWWPLHVTWGRLQIAFRNLIPRSIVLKVSPPQRIRKSGREIPRLRRRLTTTARATIGISLLLSTTLFSSVHNSSGPFAEHWRHFHEILWAHRSKISHHNYVTIRFLDGNSQPWPISSTPSSLSPLLSEQVGSHCYCDSPQCLLCMLIVFALFSPLSHSRALDAVYARPSTRCRIFPTTDIVHG